MGIPTPVQRGYLEKQSNVKYIRNTTVITPFVPVQESVHTLITRFKKRFVHLSNQSMMIITP